MKFRASLACFVCLALLLCCIGPQYGVQAQTNWTKYPGNPVVTHGPDFAWDWFVLYPNVIQEPTGYKMWFTAMTLTMGMEPLWRIGLATAPDKVTWTKHPSNPVMDVGSPGSWEEAGALAPWVLPDVTGYKMWYSGMDVAMYPKIGYATSTDGVTWTRHPGNPVLTPGAPGEWDGNATAFASVRFLGGVYHAWYAGQGADGLLRIGYATSTDGIAWTKYGGNPVLDVGAPGEWDSNGVTSPCVLVNGSNYEMWYSGVDGSNYVRIGYATSPDGINWTRHVDNPILTEGSPGDWDDQGPIGSSVLATPTGYDMWYGGLGFGGTTTGIGYANSTFPVPQPPILAGGEVTPSAGPRNARFTYNVTYSDEDNDPAAYVRVWINKSGVPFGGSPYHLKFESWKGAPDDWVAGASYALSVNLYSEGSDYTFAFSASDGKDTVFLPERAGPDVTALYGVEKIAWMSDRSGNMDIWVMDVDGSNPVQLTTDPAEDWFPDWSPDAERIVFASWRAGNSDIWVMDADGSNQTQLTTNASGDFNPVWSPDGTRIAFNSRRDGGDSDIWVMDADGGNKIQLTANVSDDRHSTWSPDGSKIAFSTDRNVSHDIWVMDADGSNKTQIQSFPGYDLCPVWSPDGSKIAFMTRRSGEHDIWTMDPDGSNQTQLTTHPEEDGAASWSPDSSRIVYYSLLAGSTDIWIMDADGSNQTQLTVDVADDLDPDFALIPDEQPPLPPVLQQAVLSGVNLENVEITWNASADEGQPGGTLRYEIWRATDYLGPYSYLDEVVGDGSPSYTCVDSGAGHGDPSNYFYRVHSVDEMASWNVTSETAGKFVRQLLAGVNFVSIPLTQVNESLEAVLQTLTFDRAWFYDPVGKEWRYYARHRPYKTDLAQMDHGMGLWVNVTAGSDLTVAGMVPANTTIQLRSGWNLVGFPSFNLTYTVADLKAEVGATRVEGFYAPGLPHCLRVVEDFEVLLVGQAYWVRVEAESDWIVSGW